MPRRRFSKADSSMDRALRRGNFDAFWREVAERRAGSPTNDQRDDAEDASPSGGHRKLQHEPLSTEHEDETRNSASGDAEIAAASGCGDQQRTRHMVPARRHGNEGSEGTRIAASQAFPRRGGRRQATRRKGYSGFAGLLVSTVNQSVVLSPTRDDTPTDDSATETVDIPRRPHTAPAGSKRPSVQISQAPTHFTFEVKSTDSSALGPLAGRPSCVQEEGQAREQPGPQSLGTTTLSTSTPQPDTTCADSLSARASVAASVAASLAHKLPSTAPTHRGGPIQRPRDKEGLALPAGKTQHDLVDTPRPYATETTPHGLVQEETALRGRLDQAVALAEQLSAAIDSNAGFSTLASSSSASRQTTL